MENLTQLQFGTLCELKEHFEKLLLPECLKELYNMFGDEFTYRIVGWQLYTYLPNVVGVTLAKCKKGEEESYVEVDIFLKDVVKN